MNKIPIEKLEDTFGRVDLHKNIGSIIQQHSTNSQPLSSIVYSGVSFKNKIKVADIGCGYGRCITHLTNVVPKYSEYIGIDPLISNESQFIKNTDKAGFIGKYICGNADRISDYPNYYFDLILCNYSLYFFVDTTREIVNKLDPSGLFITITHSKNSLFELLEDLQVVLGLDHIPTWNELGSEQILDNFNAENGYQLLQNYFKDIEKIEYKNSLVFGDGDIDHLFDLLNFKKTTLIHHNKYEEFIKSKEFDELMRKQISIKIKKNRKYILNKDDVVFQCRNPKF